MKSFETCAEHITICGILLRKILVNFWTPNCFCAQSYGKTLYANVLGYKNTIKKIQGHQSGT